MIKEIKQKYIQKIKGLIEEGENIEEKVHKKLSSYNILTQESRYRDEKYVSFAKFVEWKTSCATVVDSVIVKEGIHADTAKIFLKLKNNPDSRDWGVATLKSVLRDLEDGFFEDLEVQIDAKISVDYLEQAEDLIFGIGNNDRGYVLAAMLAGAVLEHFLRELAFKRGLLDLGERVMLNGLIELLKTNKLYKETKAKELRFWAGIRNCAAHGNFDEIERGQVNEMIKGICGFINEYQ